MNPAHPLIGRPQGHAGERTSFKTTHALPVDTVPRGESSHHSNGRSGTPASGLLEALEPAVGLFLPLTIGIAVDGLLNGRWTSLVPFLVQQTIFLLLRTFRRMRTSTEACRWTPARHLEFLGVEVNFRHLVWSILGPLALLGWYDWKLIPLGAGLLIPASLLNVALRRQAKMRSSPIAVESSRTPKRFSTTNFGVLHLFTVLVLVAALLHLCRQTSLTPGGILAAAGYLLLLIAGIHSNLVFAATRRSV